MTPLVTPADCSACDGTGRIRVSRCTHGACPCDDTRLAPCRACEGDGEQRCQDCREAVATVRDEHDVVCADCAKARAEDYLTERRRPPACVPAPVARPAPRRRHQRPARGSIGDRFRQRVLRDVWRMTARAESRGAKEE